MNRNKFFLQQIYSNLFIYLFGLFFSFYIYDFFRFHNKFKNSKSFCYGFFDENQIYCLKNTNIRSQISQIILNLIEIIEIVSIYL
jgi:hypothetical protein